jgi:anti-sigma-K factor RskA
VAPVSPPGWSRIETAIGAASPPPSVWHSLAFWRGFAIASATLAAASIAALAYIGLVLGARTPLMATLSGSVGQPNFVASVTATGNTLVIVPAALLTNDPRAYELWLIPSGETRHAARTRSAGSTDQARDPSDSAGSRRIRRRSAEPPGGSPTGPAHRPGDAAGKLTRSVRRPLWSPAAESNSRPSGPPATGDPRGSP